MLQKILFPKKNILKSNINKCENDNKFGEVNLEKRDSDFKEKGGTGESKK